MDTQKRYLRVWPAVAFVSLAAAIFAAHLYYTWSGSVWPLVLIGVASMSLGFEWNLRQRPPQRDYVSRGHVVFSVGAVVLIIAILLWLPPIIRVAQEPSFSSVAAIDAKVDRFLETQRAESPVLAAATFGGFGRGSAVLDCDQEVTRAALKPLLDAVDAARRREQRPVLLLIGMTDRMPLKPALKKQYDSNVGLAAARVDAVRACLDRARAPAPDLAPPMQILRLTTGPAYSPRAPEEAAAEAAKMALDRQVSALLFSLPATAAQPPTEPSSQPNASASDAQSWLAWPWLRGLLLTFGMGGLLGLAVVMIRKLQRQPPPGTRDPRSGTVDCQKAAEALAHVREMHQMFAELRTKNFNFFVVIVAAVIAAAASLTESSNSLLPFVAALTVALTCVIFFGIERRTVEMLGDARKELERLEEPLGVNLNRRDRWENDAQQTTQNPPRRRHITHTSLYFAAFTIVYGGALVAIRLYYPW